MATQNPEHKGAYSVQQFCDWFGKISRPHFYTLLKQGKAPRIFRIGKRTLISHEAAQEWVKRMEAETFQGVEQ